MLQLSSGGLHSEAYAGAAYRIVQDEDEDPSDEAPVKDAPTNEAPTPVNDAPTNGTPAADAPANAETPAEPAVAVVLTAF